MDQAVQDQDQALGAQNSLANPLQNLAESLGGRG